MTMVHKNSQGLGLGDPLSSYSARERAGLQYMRDRGRADLILPGFENFPIERAGFAGLGQLRPAMVGARRPTVGARPAAGAPRIVPMAARQLPRTAAPGAGGRVDTRALIASLWERFRALRVRQLRLQGQLARVVNEIAILDRKIPSLSRRCAAESSVLLPTAIRTCRTLSRARDRRAQRRAQRESYTAQLRRIEAELAGVIAELRRLLGRPPVTGADQIAGLAGIVPIPSHTKTSAFLRRQDRGVGIAVPVETIRAITAAMPLGIRQPAIERLPASGAVRRRPMMLTSIVGRTGRGAVRGAGSSAG